MAAAGVEVAAATAKEAGENVGCKDEAAAEVVVGEAAFREEPAQLLQISVSGGTG